MTVWTVIVAAGSGRRFGAAKQYELLAGRRVLDWSIRAARSVSVGIVLVVPPERVEDEEATVDAVVAGGTTRSESVRRGLARVSEEATIVLVHDGARPLADEALFQRVVEAVRDGADAVVPAVGLSDTIRDIETGTVDRSRLVAVQTPQGFVASSLRAAHGQPRDATDDASLVEAIGGRVELVHGDRANLKITEPVDLVVAQALLSAAGSGS